ncbi:putative ribonuclease H-like domain-containing protein [Tanacetum coccineum]
MIHHHAYHLANHLHHLLVITLAPYHLCHTLAHQENTPSSPPLVTEPPPPPYTSLCYLLAFLDLHNQGVIDSGCSRHMKGNMSYLIDYKEIDGGYVTFGGNPKGGKITGKDTIKTEAVNTACYVQNRVLVVKPHNQTLYELFHGRTPTLSFIRPFGCHVTILNTIDHLGKFDGKVGEGLFVGYSLNSKAFRVFNSRTWIVEENLHIRFSESIPNVVGSGPDWLFDIDALTRTMNYEPIVTDPKSSHDDGSKPSSDDGKKVDEDPRKDSECKDQEKEDNVNNTNNVNIVNDIIFNFSRDDEDDDAVAGMNNLDTTIQVSPNPTTRIHKVHPHDQVIEDLQSAIQTRKMSKNLEEHGFEELLQFKLQEVWTLVDLPNGKWAIGSKWVFRNKNDERGIVIRNKARLVAQGYTQEEGIDYDEVFAPVARIEAIMLFLAYASFKDFMVYQLDVKSAFLYGKIEEEVYVCQPLEFEDPDFPDRVYKVEKALYGLHQAPRAWYETLSTYLLDNGFQRGKIDKTLFIKRYNGDILMVQVYVDDIIFGSTKKKLCFAFEKFTEVKTASTPIETQKPLLKDEDGEEVDLHMYRSMIGSLMYLTSLRPDIMFAVCACARYQVNPKVLHLHVVKRIFRYLKGQLKLGLWYPKDFPFDLVAYTDSDYAGVSLDRKSTTGGCQFLRCRLISWQCKKQTVVANSTTEAEYVAASSCCRQVLWIQNQLLDYGDCNEKKLIQMVKIHTDKNVADLLTKAFDFWSTVMAKTINEEEQLHALVDGKKIIITESSVRRDLQLADEEGVDCLPNSTIFEQLTLMGPKTTAWNEYSSTMAPAIVCLSTNQKFNFSKFIFESMIRNLDNLSGKFLMCPRRVKKLEKKNRSKTHRLKRLYKVGLTAKVESFDNEESLGEDASKQGRIDAIDADEEITLVSVHDVNVFAGEEVFVAEQEVADITLAQALVKMKSTKLKKKGVVIQELGESTTTISSQLSSQQSQDKEEANIALIETWDDIQAKIDVDHQLAERMQAQEQEELSIEEKATLFQQLLEKRRKHFAAKRAEEKRNKPPTKAQQRKIMCTYLKNMEGYKLKDLKLKEFDSIQEMFDRAFKRQKVEDDKETAKLKQLMEIIPDEEVAIDAIPLAVKSPISQMLKNFDREDLEDLYKLVKAKYESTRPLEDLDLILWGDLKTMFEPHVKDKIYMLVEKKYPLAPLTLSMMLEKKLIIDYESEMACQLLKFIMK